jgi:phenylacetate-coenzyme A ligase PaaK-like adenylate-forming protein
LVELPVLSKTILMDRWDDIVTDRTLNLDAVLGFVEELDEPARLNGRHLVATTSGTTGLKGVFVYDPDEWLWVLASYARANDWAGIPAGLTHRLRLAVVSTTAPWHQSAVVGASLKGPLVPTLRLDATRPMEHIVSELNAFMPESLVAYAGMAERLAREQLSGRLRITPRTVFCASEVLTAGARSRVQQAFGSEPFETYAATETASIASDCRLHRLHVYEDLVAPEFVDDDNRPVPPGTYGARVLVSVLFSRTLPLIRYEISDSVVPSADACECGLPFLLIDRVRGRREDVLSLDGISGSVSVQPGVFGDALESRGVAAWQIVQESGRQVRALIVAADGFSQKGLEVRIARALEAAGAMKPEVVVQRVATLERTAVGKTPLVRGLRKG